ncbi:Flp pilus assembly protein CpaB [Phenylobacterium hankyongense]|uniref:Flp pilus assembly protein CpaB n=1 Tax=Phenylobacterium hankyongense TaxID=1813876 RepID=A0A328AVF1_9CAUL|nr:Flp pilus assembly protein CpaB [Phenylobacterium hankyongense]RAK58983.1 Flp pilus assembly protein CpaB [Phenylobacterium hankyongense]
MRVVTIVSLGASAVLGLAALVVAKTVLPNAASAKVPAAASRAVTGVPVVVASKPMKFGDRLDAEHLTLAHLPPEAVPEGAFTTVAAVLAQDHGGAPVALTPIAVREPLLPSKLSGPGARPSVAAEIAEGMRAYTIKVSDVSGVGGHALPGDRVDVVLLRDLTPEASQRNFVSDVVLQDVRVLAVDLNADLTSNKPATPSTATLEVSVQDSQKLAVASDLGKLSLALRKTGSSEVASVAPMRPAAFVAGGRPAPTLSRAPAPRRRATPSEDGGLIAIVELEGGGSKPRTPRAAKPAAAPAAPVPAGGLQTTASDLKPNLS